jgi:hypothetical protein
MKRKIYWVVTLVLTVLSCPPQAFGRARPGPQKSSFLNRLLRRPKLPEPGLVLRFVEATEQAVALSYRFLGKHPRVREIRRRLAFLKKALVRAPAAGPGSLLRVGRGLTNRLTEIKLERADLMRRYLSAHPTVRAIDRRIKLYKRLIRIFAARGVRLKSSLWKVHNLIVRRAEARGRLRALLMSYRAAHPKVARVRAVIASANRRLKGLNVSITGPACMQLFRAYTRAIDRLRGTRVRQLHARASVRETDAALDTLIVERAKLLGVRGCKPSGN